jgi:hypothetical protein
MDMYVLWKPDVNSLVRGSGAIIYSTDVTDDVRIEKVCYDRKQILRSRQLGMVTMENESNSVKILLPPN